MAERDPHTPPYQLIADDLQWKIKTGQLLADAPLPSEEELADRWNCDLPAARHAFIELRNMGLIYFDGRRAFVAKSPPLVRVHWDRFRRRPITQPTYRQESERAGVDLQVTHESERVEAPPDVAERLGIAANDPVMEISYSISMGGQPDSFSICWEPLAITGGTEIEYPHEGPQAGKGIVARFDAIGYHVDAEEETLQIRMPEPHEKLRLQIPDGVPVVQIWQTFWAGDTPVEIAKIIFRADRYQFRFRTEID
jgi:GntR family transcriptional regulator